MDIADLGCEYLLRGLLKHLVDEAVGSFTDLLDDRVFVLESRYRGWGRALEVANFGEIQSCFALACSS